jgi:hypothetical protein
VILDNFLSFSPGSAQLTWLENDLAASSQFWKFVIFHVPPYASTSSQAARDNSNEVRYLVPLFERYHVSMVLTGHWHYYERMKPLLGGQVSTIEAGAVVYLITGGGGAGLASVGSGTLNSRTAVKVQAFHLSMFDINDCQLQLSAVRKVSGSGDTFDSGDIFDSYTIDRCGGSPPPTLTATNTPATTATSTPTRTPAVTATRTATRTPSATRTATATRTPSATRTATVTRTPAASATPTATGNTAATATPTNTPLATATPTATSNATATPTPTPGGSRLKEITFEGGSLTDPATGADSTAGTVSLETSAPLGGGFSATIPNAASSYLQESFTASPDIYVAFRVRVNALPGGTVRLVMFSNAGTTVGSIQLLTDGRLQLRNGSATVGTSTQALSAGQTYRIGLHQKAGSGGNAVLEAYLVADGQSFGAPFAATTSGSWTDAADRLRIGATAATAVNATFDDILLDSAVLP